MAEMKVDVDSLPTQQSGSSNASVNPSPTTETAKKVDEGKKTEKRKQKTDTSEAWRHFTRDPDDPNYSVCNHCTRRFHCAKKVLRDLYAHYSHEVGVINENPTSSSENIEEEIVIDVDDDPTTFLNNQYKRLLEENSSGTGFTSQKDLVKVLDKGTSKSLGDSRSLFMKLDNGGVALYRRRGTPPAGCRWKASERRGSTGLVSLESVGWRGGAGRRSELGGFGVKRDVGGGRSYRCRELRRREMVLSK
ncbi:unnamed protein product [Lactuca saligna]|uniref:BED-type domain-containing protein n=1 Tax=Lactuca saligna TaxID=75948 RepID=A0AA36A1C0_LACSI|nr:unnamed protein product [Lactuca saligna]